MAKVFINVRNNQKATLISEEPKFKTVILQFEDGTTKSLTTATIKRWYREVKEEEIVEEPVKEIPKKKEKVNKESKTEKIKDSVPKQGTSKKVSTKVSVDTQPIFDYVTARAEELGLELFNPPSGVKVIAFKIGGKMTGRMNYSKKAITLCFREKVTGNVATPTKTINHLFNAGYQFTSLTTTDKKLIDKLLKASTEAQVLVNANKAAKKNKKDKKEEN